jgi:hypothetical protein
MRLSSGQLDFRDSNYTTAIALHDSFAQAGDQQKSRSYYQRRDLDKDNTGICQPWRFSINPITASTHSHRLPSPLQQPLQPTKTSPTSPLSRNRKHVLLPNISPTPPTLHPNPKLRPRPQHSIHALERPLHHHKLFFSNRCRPLWIHGTCFPTWRFVVLVEQRSGYKSWRDCGV